MKYFLYKVLNAPNEKITFLGNFSHLFVVLWLKFTSINEFLISLGFFLRIISWKGASLFNRGKQGAFFSCGEVHF